MENEYFKIKKSYLYALCSVIICATIAACTWGLDERHKPPAAACPYSFWVPDNVAAEFRKYPEGHPMREFFKAHVSQQRQLDAYNGYPGVHGAR